jgi:hypothetical protein
MLCAKVRQIKLGIDTALRSRFQEELLTAWDILARTYSIEVAASQRAAS